MKCLCSLGFLSFKFLSWIIADVPASGVPATILKAWQKTHEGKEEGNVQKPQRGAGVWNKGRKTPETAAHFQINRQTA